MEIYYCCSYTGSPCGYDLGKLEYDGGAPAARTLSGGPFDPLIKSCFDHGIVKKAHGLLPTDPPRWFLLIKDLSFRDADNTEFYINIALVTGDKSQYRRWTEKGPSKDAIAELCRQTMVIDRTPEFGFTIDGACLTKLTECSFGSLLTQDASNPTGEETFIELLSATTDLKEAALELGLADGAMELKRVSEGSYWAKLVKKKKNRASGSARPHQKHTITPKGKYGLLILAALALALLLILTICSKSKS